ncbi:6,7-dimethyl-8-ribityllumazine synthase [Candidatus Microgenomates bacterium]|nr:6,7-dimethyl-8-ribityllumazine synthase [Candidatus Microgenomates bacterium]
MKSNKIRLAIIAALYRQEVTDILVKTCVATLLKKGLKKEQITVVRVPGTWELHLTAKKLAKSSKFNALICFGVIKKGNTYHFEQLANECARVCMQIGLDYEIPLVYEVLPVYDMKDAMHRAISSDDNRAVEGATTALKMIELLKSIARER